MKRLLRIFLLLGMLAVLLGQEQKNWLKVVIRVVDVETGEAVGRSHVQYSGAMLNEKRLWVDKRFDGTGYGGGFCCGAAHWFWIEPLKEFNLNASSEGYVSLGEESSFRGKSGVAGSGTQEVVLKLGRPAAVEGRVGRAGEEAGLSGAQVKLFRPGVKKSMAQAVSNSDGRFQMASTAPGKYKLLVLPPMYDSVRFRQGEVEFGRQPVEAGFCGRWLPDMQVRSGHSDLGWIGLERCAKFAVVVDLGQKACLDPGDRLQIQFENLETREVDEHEVECARSFHWTRVPAGRYRVKVDLQSGPWSVEEVVEIHDRHERVRMTLRQEVH